MRSTIFGIAIVAVSIEQAFAAVGTFVLFPNRDSQGGALYNGAPVQTADEASCRLVCTLDPLCYGYTWVQPSNPTWSGNCYRKGTTACNPRDLGIVATGKFSGLIANSCGDVYCGTTKVNVDASSCTTPGPTPTGRRARMRRLAEMDEQRAKQLQLCPSGTTACSLSSLSTSGYECVDLNEELERCGDCNTDCTAMPGARAVACRSGRCVVGQCQKGFTLSSNPMGAECKKLSSFAAAPIPRHRSRRSGGL